MGNRMVRETNLSGGSSRTASRAWATASSASAAADWTLARRAAWRRSWENQNKTNASLIVNRDLRETTYVKEPTAQCLAPLFKEIRPGKEIYRTNPDRENK